MRASWFVVCVVPMAGCFFGGCPGPGPEQSCSDDDPPASDVAIELYSDGDPLEDGAVLSLDYGGQGGQHFYISVRAFGVLPEEFVLATFESTDGNSGSARIFFAEPCDAWSVVDDEVLQTVMASASSGTVRVQLGQCDGSCEYSAEDGTILNFVARASDERAIELSP